MPNGHRRSGAVLGESPQHEDEAQFPGLRYQEAVALPGPSDFRCAAEFEGIACPLPPSLECISERACLEGAVLHCATDSGYSPGP